MQKKSDARQTKLFAGIAGIAALALLSACAADGPAEEPPADQEVEQQTVQPEDDAGQETTDATTEQDDDTADDTAATSNDDPVFDIISAVETEYADGFIVDMDREDGGSKFEVDVVVGNELYELDVTADGNISVDDRDDDDDKIAKANNATVTVTEAINQAFDQHSDTTFDQISLDDDDGSLHWEIELDDANGSDIELDIPAN